MERAAKRQIVEALILAAAEPVSAAKIAVVVPHCTPELVCKLVEELNAEYNEQQRAFEIWEVAGGFQFRTRLAYARYLQQLQAQRPLRLSHAALETLAIVAYRQPATRAEIEHVRGVDVGPILRGLIERKLVRITGHRDVAGRPLLYATTPRFLEVFGLRSLEDLPTLRDLRELSGGNAQRAVPASEGEADLENLEAAATEMLPEAELH